MTIAVRNALIAAVLVLVSMLGFAGWLGMTHLALVNAYVEEIGVNWLPSVDLANKIATAVTRLRASEARYVMSNSDAQKAETEKINDDQSKAVLVLRAKYETMIASDEERRIYHEFSRILDIYIKKSKEIITLSRKNENVKAAIAYAETGNEFCETMRYIDHIVEITKSSVERRYEHSAKTYRNAAVAMTILICVSLLIGAVAVTYVVFSRDDLYYSSRLQTAERSHQYQGTGVAG